MIDLSFLRQLDRFNLALKRRVHSQFSGQRESTAVGSGLIFSDHREYVPGDEIRNIDWRVYARTDNYFIKRFEEERNLRGCWNLTAHAPTVGGWRGLTRLR